MHKAHTEGNRRGLVVYYKQEHAYMITKEACSKAFDILWLRMKTKKEERIIGFFYAPGAHHTERMREMFYDELRIGIDKYKGKKIYLLGDSNARLGEYSGDKDIHGNIKTNKNKALLMGLIHYTGMEYLNKIYAKGTPTFEIWGQKRSIIDVAIANNLSEVKNFEVISRIMGTNAQTGHKIIELTLRASRYQETRATEKVKKYRFCSEEGLIRVRNEVAIKCKLLRLIRGSRPPSIYSYDVLRRLYYNA